MSGGSIQQQRANGIGHPPADVTVVLVEEEGADDSFKNNEMWALVSREARAVSVWAVLAPLMRLAFAPLISRASDGTGEACASSNLSVLAGWLLGAFPRSAAQNMAPGFMFASAWILFAVRDNFGGIIPNVPLRICEMVMGRLTLYDLCIVLPVHFLCTLSTFMILKLLLPTSMASIALAPITYSNDNAWLVDFIREVAVNCAFTVTFLVLPEFFALNKVPRFLTAVVMYPLYSFGVDASVKGSTFGPDVLYALAAVGRLEGLGQTTSRFAGVVIGGFLGGNIMRRYFP